MTGVLGITLKHATRKHAQTIGLLQRYHASIRQALKIETGKQASEDHCGTITSVLRSLTIILLTLQVLAVRQAEFFMAEFLMESWI